MVERKERKQENALRELGKDDNAESNGWTRIPGPMGLQYGYAHEDGIETKRQSKCNVSKTNERVVLSKGVVNRCQARCKTVVGVE